VCQFPTTDPCGICNEANCCAPMKSFWSDANSYPFVDCVTPCTVQTCFDQCISQYPTAGGKYSAWVQCEQTSCSSSCGWPHRRARFSIRSSLVARRSSTPRPRPRRWPRRFDAFRPLVW